MTECLNFITAFIYFGSKKAIAKVTLIFAVNRKKVKYLKKHELITLRTETYSIVFSLFLRHF